MTPGTGRPLLPVGAVALLAACALFSGQDPHPREPFPGELALVSGESAIWFVGIKNNAVAFPGSFMQLRGALSTTERRAWVEVPIASLDTGSPERDANLRTHFFDEERFPIARMTVEDLGGPITLPQVGGVIEAEVVGTLEIHGTRVELSVPVRISREGMARLRVTTPRPLVLTVEELDLTQEHAALMAISGHEALSRAVPIQVDLVFEGSEP